VPRYVHAHGCLANTRTSLGAPPTLVGVSEAKRQNPDAAMRARERDGLFEMVKNARAGDVRPHPEECAREKLSANSNARARVSKDGDERLPAHSCFETHRSALRRRQRLRSRRAAMLLGMRATRRRAFWPNEVTRRTPREGPTCTCGRRWSIVCGLLFTMKIPTETCGPFASAAHFGETDPTAILAKRSHCRRPRASGDP
jgi:hypothetical protein